MKSTIIEMISNLKKHLWVSEAIYSETSYKPQSFSENTKASSSSGIQVLPIIFNLNINRTLQLLKYLLTLNLLISVSAVFTQSI